jgi:hypothetical protein
LLSLDKIEPKRYFESSFCRNDEPVFYELINASAPQYIRRESVSTAFRCCQLCGKKGCTAWTLAEGSKLCEMRILNKTGNKFFDRFAEIDSGPVDFSRGKYFDCSYEEQDNPYLHNSSTLTSPPK